MSENAQDCPRASHASGHGWQAGRAPRAAGNGDYGVITCVTTRFYIDLA